VEGRECTYTLNLMLYLGTITVKTLYDFVEKYVDSNGGKNEKVVKAIVYGIFSMIVLINIVCSRFLLSPPSLPPPLVYFNSSSLKGALTISFAYRKPYIELSHLDQNFYEYHCNFGTYGIIILPLTIVSFFFFFEL